MLPLSTNIRDAYKNGKEDEQNFIQNLALFLCTFLKEHGLLIEQKQELQNNLLEVANSLPRAFPVVGLVRAGCGDKALAYLSVFCYGVYFGGYEIIRTPHWFEWLLAETCMGAGGQNALMPGGNVAGHARGLSHLCPTC